MRASIVIAVALLALLAAQGASAHNGDVWFLDRQGITENIKSKYRISAVSCRPALANEGGHWFTDDYGTRWYDHWVCGVWSQPTRRACVVLAHVTGGRWNDIVLTSWPYRGCAPRDIRKK